MEDMVKENGLVEVDEPSKVSEKLFTQEQVNEIIKKRLERQKENNIDTQELDARAAELNSRESRLNCREYLIEKGYPAELLDIIDTTDVENFKKKADRANNVYFSMQQENNVAPLANLEGNYDVMASAFENTKHEPRKFGKHYNG